MYGSLYSENEDISKNAYLNWRMDQNDIPEDMACMANCYSKSVIILIDSILNNNIDHKADALIFPILFSIGHVIELYIKAILFKANEYYGLGVEKKLTHDLPQLYDELASFVSTHEYDTSIISDLQLVNKYIDEVYSQISSKNKPKKQNHDFARYPITSDNELQFYIGTKNVIVDVENLKHYFSRIDFTLGALYLYYYHKVHDDYQY